MPVLRRRNYFDVQRRRRGVLHPVLEVRRVIEYKNGKGTDSPWHMETMKLPPAERARARSKTFPGVADAMADQWGAWALRQRENGGA